MNDNIIDEIDKLKFKQYLILCALRNILEQNNPNGVNDYLIKQIDRELRK